MALGAQDVQAAKLEHFLLLFLAALLELLDELGEFLRLRLRVAIGLLELPAREHLRVAAEQDVRAAAGHVRADRDGALAPGLRHDERLVRVVLRVQHVVRHLLLLENAGDGAALLDAGGADEHGAPLLVLLHDLADDGRELLALRLVDHVVAVFADQRLVRRDHRHVELVGARELLRLGLGRAGHAGELVVEPEQVLEGDGGHRATLFLNRHVFLGLDGLVQAVAPAAPGQHAAGELVDDQHLAVLADHVVLVALVQRVRTQELVGDVQRLDVDRIVQVRHPQHLLDGFDAVVREGDGERLLVDQVVLVLAQTGHHLVDGAVLLAGGLGGAADDERRACLVDQDRVDLVHDRVVQAALRVFQRRELHVVAQVVEAELVVLPVADVRAVGRALLVVGLLVDDGADAQAHEVVQLAHPLGVACGQVVVDRDQVHALAFERVEVDGQRGDERLAFARLHLGDGALVQHHAADELHVVVPHLEHAPAGLAADGKGFNQDVVEARAVVELLLELRRLGLQLGVAELLDLRFEIVDGGNARAHLAQGPLVRGAEDTFRYPGEHCFPFLSVRPEPTTDSEGRRGPVKSREASPPGPVAPAPSGRSGRVSPPNLRSSGRHRPVQGQPSLLLNMVQ